MATCPNGHQNADESAFCVECGAPLGNAPSVPNGPASQPNPRGFIRSRGMVIGTAVAGVVVLVAVIGLVVAVSSGGKSGSSKSNTAAATLAQATTIVVPATQPNSATTVAAPPVSQATAAPTLTPSPTPSPTPAPTPIPTPTPETLASMVYIVPVGSAVCRQAANGTASPVTTIPDKALLTIDQKFTIRDATWYRLADQRCWFSANDVAELNIYPTKVEAQHEVDNLSPAGTVLYQADWSNGPNGWPQAFGWKVLSGMLVNDGSANQGTLIAPYVPGDAGITDYAVEAEIQVVRPETYGWLSFIVRSQYYGQIWKRNCCDDAYIYAKNKQLGVKDSAVTLGLNWHTYRLEVKGSTIIFKIDGATLISTQDLSLSAGGTVGIQIDGANMQLLMRSFKVIKL